MNRTIKLVKSIQTDKTLRILSICQIDSEHMYLDGGKIAHIMNIDLMESVLSFQTKQPTRYVTSIKNGRYLACGMETKDLHLYALDLKNPDVKTRCLLYQSLR